MSNIKDKAKEYLSYQLSVMPTREDKNPTRPWTAYQSNRLREAEVDNTFSGANVQGVAIICGANSSAHNSYYLYICSRQSITYFCLPSSVTLVGRPVSGRGLVLPGWPY